MARIRGQQGFVSFPLTTSLTASPRVLPRTESLPLTTLLLSVTERSEPEIKLMKSYTGGQITCELSYQS